MPTFHYENGEFVYSPDRLSASWPLLETLPSLIADARSYYEACSAGDTLGVEPWQPTTIMAIGDEHGVKMTKAAATDLILTFTATMLGSRDQSVGRCLDSRLWECNQRDDSRRTH